MRLLIIFLLLALGGCARIPAEPPVSIPLTQRSAADLIAKVWPAGEGEWRIRQSALLELGPARIPMSGFLLLHPGEARLVGLDDLGVKLFDLTVTPAGHTEHFLLPELARLPRVGETIAASVRRIFLAPRPAAGDRPRQKDDGIALERKEERRKVQFLFGGPAMDLKETQVRGGGEDWRVRYSDYRPEGESRIPREIILDDLERNYRLTLWLEEVRSS